jgi:hypothetical protein
MLTWSKSHAHSSNALQTPFAMPHERIKSSLGTRVNNWPYSPSLYRDKVARKTRAAVKTPAGREMNILTPLEFENPMSPRRTVISC